MLKSGAVVTVYAGAEDEARVADLLAKYGHTWLRTTGLYVASTGTVEVVMFRVGIRGRGSGRLVKELRELRHSAWVDFDVTGDAGF